MPIIENVGGVLRTHSAEFENVGGVIREKQSVLVNDGGVMRTVFSSGTRIGDLKPGDIIKIKEDGIFAEFYVCKHNYESGLNGAGRTLVVRKDCYDQRQWHTSNVNAYASCTLDSWFNNTYINLLDADTRAAIGQTKFYYTPGNGNTSVTTLQRAVFALSATELGYADEYINVEGSALSIANTLKTAKLNGSAVKQWTRSPYTGDPYSAWFLGVDGDFEGRSCSLTYGVRPAFTLLVNYIGKR